MSSSNRYGDDIMGRTKRLRKTNKRKTNLESSDIAAKLQKSMQLKFSHLKICYFVDTGRGILSRKKILKEDILIALPLSHLITTKTNSAVFSILTLDNQPDQLILAIWLIHEHHLREKSKYFDYIQSLPHYYTNLYFCTEKEANLMPEFLQKDWLKQRMNIKSTFEELILILENEICSCCGKILKDLFTLEQFLWAWFTVNTRSVYYEDSGTKSLALAPLLDMFNHSNNAETKMNIDFEKGFYILKTLVEYKKREQVFIKYGPHSNLKLLVEYGFVIPENSHDFVEFTFAEVVDAVKSLGLNYGEITKPKYKFIKENNLNKNLTKNKEEFSWNFNGLVYVLTTKDQVLPLLQSKTYSNNFNSAEMDDIMKVGKALTCRKLKELNNVLLKMENYGSCSESFEVVKNLIRIYINILK